MKRCIKIVEWYKNVKYEVWWQKENGKEGDSDPRRLTSPGQKVMMKKAVLPLSRYGKEADRNFYNKVLT